MSWYFTAAGKGYHVNRNQTTPNKIDVTGEEGRFVLSLYDYEADGVITSIRKECGLTDHPAPPDSAEMRLRQVENAVKGFNDLMGRDLEAAEHRMQRNEDHANGLQARLDVVESRLDRMSDNVLGDIINALVNR